MTPKPLIIDALYLLENLYALSYGQDTFLGRIEASDDAKQAAGMSTARCVIITRLRHNPAGAATRRSSHHRVAPVQSMALVLRREASFDVLPSGRRRMLCSQPSCPV
jgi:hypothetical protein